MDSPYNNGVYYKVETLPSKFLPYPVNTTIEYRSLTVGEMKYLSTVTNWSYTETIKFLSNLTRGIDVRSITVGDSRWLIILIGMASRGSAADIGWNFFTTCPECGHEIVKMIKPNQVDFWDISVDSLPLYMTTDDKKHEIEINPVTLGIIEALDKEVQKHKDDKDDFFKTFDSDIAMDALCIQSSFKSYEEAYNFLNNEASLNDVNIISEAIEMTNHNIKPLKLKCTNPECKHEFEREFIIDFADLFRSGEDSSDLRTRIRTSKVSKPAN